MRIAVTVLVIAVVAWPAVRTWRRDRARRRAEQAMADAYEARLAEIIKQELGEGEKQ